MRTMLGGFLVFVLCSMAAASVYAESNNDNLTRYMRRAFSASSEDTAQYYIKKAKKEANDADKKDVYELLRKASRATTLSAKKRYIRKAKRLAEEE